MIYRIVSYHIRSDSLFPPPAVTFPSRSLPQRHRTPGMPD